MVKAPQPCPVCNKTRVLTDEDVIPNWARTAVIKHFGADSQDQAPPRVKMQICMPCNSDLGRLFEHKAAPLMKPMLNGDSVVLHPAAQLIVGDWFVKLAAITALLAGGTSPGNNQQASSTLQTMLSHGHPAALTSVRLGHIDPHADEGSDVIRPLRPDTMSHLLPPALPSYAYCSIGMVGHLFYEVLISHGAQVGKYIDRTPDTDWLIRIHPVALLPKVWPPERQIARSEGNVLSLIWRSLRDPRTTLGVVGMRGVG